MPSSDRSQISAIGAYVARSRQEHTYLPRCSEALPSRTLIPGRFSVQTKTRATRCQSGETDGWMGRSGQFVAGGFDGDGRTAYAWRPDALIGVGRPARAGAPAGWGDRPTSDDSDRGRGLWQDLPADLLGQPGPALLVHARPSRRGAVHARTQPVRATADPRPGRRAADRRGGARAARPAVPAARRPRTDPRRPARTARGQRFWAAGGGTVPVRAGQPAHCAVLAPAAAVLDRAAARSRSTAGAGRPRAGLHRGRDARAAVHRDRRRGRRRPGREAAREHRRLAGRDRARGPLAAGLSAGRVRRRAVPAGTSRRAAVRLCGRRGGRQPAGRHPGPAALGVAAALVHRRPVRLRRAAGRRRPAEPAGPGRRAALAATGRHLHGQSAGPGRDSRDRAAAGERLGAAAPTGGHVVPAPRGHPGGAAVRTGDWRPANHRRVHLRKRL